MLLYLLIIAIVALEIMREGMWILAIRQIYFISFAVSVIVFAAVIGAVIVPLIKN